MLLTVIKGPIKNFSKQTQVNSHSAQVKQTVFFYGEAKTDKPEKEVRGQRSGGRTDAESLCSHFRLIYSLSVFFFFRTDGRTDRRTDFTTIIRIICNSNCNNNL